MTEIRSITLVALGGNLPSEAGNPQQTLIAAVKALPEYGLRLQSVSRFFATPCFPAGAGPDYVNAVIAVEGNQSPRELLEHLHAMEARFARKRVTRWAGRTLDLDLLASGDSVLPDRTGFDAWRSLPLERQMQEAPEQLILPHPRIQDRAFVLVPLCDIAPGWVHPVLGQSAAEMLAALPEGEAAGVVPL